MKLSHVHRALSVAAAVVVAATVAAAVAAAAVSAAVVAAAVVVAVAAATAVAHATKSHPSIEFDLMRPSHCGADAFFNFTLCVHVLQMVKRDPHEIYFSQCIYATAQGVLNVFEM